MKIQFPTGFLAKLSKKSLEELHTQASNFEYKTTDREYDNRHSLEVLSCLYETHTGRIVRNDGYTLTRKGFFIEEKSYVDEIAQLRKDSDELKSLKKSLETIKSALTFGEGK